VRLRRNGILGVFARLKKWGEIKKEKIGKGRKSRDLSASVSYLTLPSPSFTLLALATYIPTTLTGLLARMQALPF